MVITTDEVILMIIDEHRFTHKIRNILPPAYICSYISLMATERLLGHRKLEMVKLVVECTEFCHFRIDDLVVFIAMGRYIGPMKH